MAIFAKLPAIRALFCVVIAFGLLLAPLQGVGATQAVAGMAMSDETCLQKRSCCDKVKSDCATAQSCFAKCGGVPGLMLIGKTPISFASAEEFSLQAMFLTPRASAPLRRPPRA